jgi:hypothetical protein
MTEEGQGAEMSEDGSGLGGDLFSEAHHICMVFDEEEQRRKVVVEFLAGGLRRGEIVRYAADVISPEEVRTWLVGAGVDVPEDESFSVFGAESFYVPRGRFDPHEMISAMISRYEQLRRAGCPGIRSCGEMTWALKDIPGSDGLLEYEALLNTVTGTFPHSGMCLYDARRFGGAALFRILAVHPYMIAQGQIVRNPYYVRHDEFRTRPLVSS